MSGMDRLTMDGARDVRDELHALGLDGDLFMRLTGFYRVGPDGPVEPEFGYRDFTGSDLRQPIQTDAAAMIRELLAHRRASQAAPAPSDGLREAWHKTTDGLPKKPGLKSYEQIECLIKLPNGDLEISMWNCEHEVWDDAEGDDYRHDPYKPTHWMDLAPFRAALSASPGQEGEPRHD